MFLLRPLSHKMVTPKIAPRAFFREHFGNHFGSHFGGHFWSRFGSSSGRKGRGRDFCWPRLARHPEQLGLPGSPAVADTRRKTQARAPGGTGGDPQTYHLGRACKGAAPGIHAHLRSSSVSALSLTESASPRPIAHGPQTAKSRGQNWGQHLCRPSCAEKKWLQFMFLCASAPQPFLPFLKC